MKHFYGLDPGIEGYACRLSEDGPTFYPAPVMDGEMDPAAMLQQIEGWLQSNPPDLLVIERQQAFPGKGARCPACFRPRNQQGVASTGKTLYGYGLWVGMLMAKGIPVRVVSAQEWKGPLGLDADKAKSVAKAQTLFPGLDLRPLERSPRARVPDHNKCEALLLAVTARRILKDGR